MGMNMDRAGRSEGRVDHFSMMTYINSPFTFQGIVTLTTG